MTTEQDEFWGETDCSGCLAFRTRIDAAVKEIARLRFELETAEFEARLVEAERDHWERAHGRAIDDICRLHDERFPVRELDTER